MPRAAKPKAAPRKPPARTAPRATMVYLDAADRAALHQLAERDARAAGETKPNLTATVRRLIRAAAQGPPRDDCGSA